MLDKRFDSPRATGSVPQFLAQWRTLDACVGPTQSRTPYSDVIEQHFSGCAGGASVQHDRVSDADHGWPGEDDLSERSEFSSTRRTWAFLSSFRRPAS